MSIENEVSKASEKFYAALNRMLRGDTGPLADIWSHSPVASAMHPIGGRDVGWNAVRESFEKVAELASSGNVELRDQIIRVSGDVACETGLEHGQVKLAGQQVAIEHRVTNLYQRENGSWKLVHHHTDTSPDMVDVINAL